jgi:hypothetical protein
MSWAKGFALVVAFVGAIGLGVWTGPYITHRASTVGETIASTTQSPAASVEASRAAPNAPRAATIHRPKAKSKQSAAEAPALTASVTTPTVPAAAPALHVRLKPLLNKGADMGIASEDFDTAEQFAAVAHAARNTNVPFMVLKDRVVYKGKSLEAALREFKPDLNAAAEAQRAHSEAKSDLEG